MYTVVQLQVIQSVLRIATLSPISQTLADHVASLYAAYYDIHYLQ